MSILRVLAALIVIIISVSVAAYFATIFANASLPSVADRNGIGAFLFIVIPLAYILHRVSKWVLSNVPK